MPNAQKKSKIAIVVPGRFHAFYLANALAARGHQVVLLTNYPTWATRRLGLKQVTVVSFWMHGLLSRANFFLNQVIKIPIWEAGLHTLFGWWAANWLRRQTWDLVHCWSGISEEILKANIDAKHMVLVRGSPHIRVHADILKEEENRVGIPLDRPSEWTLKREEREYALAPCIRTISKFAHRSFIQAGVPQEKLWLVPSANPVDMFRPDAATVQARIKRVLAGEPLKTLYVGALTFGKGLFDWHQITQQAQGKSLEFFAVGPLSAEAKQFFQTREKHFSYKGKKAQRTLPKVYAEADLFLFPTLAEGYAQVMAQAYAACLPILATTNCQSEDLIEPGKTGWILPIRSPGRFLEQLRWCDEHRKALADMIQALYANGGGRRWEQVAQAFEKRMEVTATKY